MHIRMRKVMCPGVRTSETSCLKLGRCSQGFWLSISGCAHSEKVLWMYILPRPELWVRVKSSLCVTQHGDTKLNLWLSPSAGHEWPYCLQKIRNVLRMEYLIRCSKISTRSSEYTSNLKGVQLWSKNQCESVSPTVVQRKVTTCAVERQEKPATRKGIVLQVLATDHCFPLILMNFFLVLFFLSVLVTSDAIHVCCHKVCCVPAEGLVTKFPHVGVIKVILS